MRPLHHPTRLKDKGIWGGLPFVQFAKVGTSGRTTHYTKIAMLNHMFWLLLLRVEDVPNCRLQTFRLALQLALLLICI